MADLNPLLGGLTNAAAGQLAGLQNALVDQQMDALRYQMLAQMSMIRPSEPDFAVRESEGRFIASFICSTTAQPFSLSSSEKPAVERGMQHFVAKWKSAIQHLQSAGLQKDELTEPLAKIAPRLLKEAERERDLEEGVRQAEGKARALLLMCLTPEQKTEFNAHQRFTVMVEEKISGFPSGAFRIKKGASFNVEHVESGEMFCVVAREKVPVYDQMLTQKLLLEREPERFFKTANRTGGGVGLNLSDYYNRYMQEAMQSINRNYDNEFIQRSLQQASPAVASRPAVDTSAFADFVRLYRERERGRGR